MILGHFKVKKKTVLTLSLHEFVQKVAPVPWFWLELVHAIKVEKGHYIVLCITSHIDNLHKNKSSKL